MDRTPKRVLLAVSERCAAARTPHTRAERPRGGEGTTKTALEVRLNRLLGSRRRVHVDDHRRPGRAGSWGALSRLRDRRNPRIRIADSEDVALSEGLDPKRGPSN